MTARRLVFSPLLALAAAIATFILVALALQSERIDPTSSSAFADRPTPDEVIREAEARVAADPAFVPGLTRLAEGYFARAAQTGDPSWITKADEAGRAAVAADPKAFQALDALAVIAASRHRFVEALDWTERSLAVAPTRVAPLSIRTDALVELGRYRAGFAAAQQRLDLRPDLASYSRASYVRELQGDHAGAVRLMRLAIGSGAIGSGDRVAARTQLGLVFLAQGEVADAEREIRGALAESPGNTDATFALGQIHQARGELRQAERLYESVVAALPEADHFEYLAEVERALGMTADSERHVEAARAAFDALAANGQDIDLDRALFEANLHRPTAADIAMARRGQAARAGIAGDQVLGWVLTRAGRCAEGDRYATRSLRLGTRDASLLFHAGMAASCAGRPAVARQRLAAALEINPAFSLKWAKVARAELARLS